MRRFVGTTVLLLLTTQFIHAQVFPGFGIGPIPDDTGSCSIADTGEPLDVTFNVTGVFPPLTVVEVDIGLIHTWMGDVAATLIAPSGEQHLLFGATGATTDDSCGDSTDLAGVYNITDFTGGTDWWTVAAGLGAADFFPSGDYNSTESGGDGQVAPAPITSMFDAFNGVTTPNGTWILRVTDKGTLDTGTVTAANLFLQGGVDPDIIFMDGFETSPLFTR
ncbi:proprotein convertase P-domain-containing protein [Marinicella sp. W31]|uniref:proprotein convertase P-domain-containing protein n=1 Tax=Marinicella sp. W31 TaxID=3023713 RepID=UPI003756F315